MFLPLTSRIAAWARVVPETELGVGEPGRDGGRGDIDRGEIGRSQPPDCGQPARGEPERGELERGDTKSACGRRSGPDGEVFLGEPGDRHGPRRGV
eukprot:5453870-Prymnesium_polylepis.1